MLWVRYTELLPHILSCMETFPIQIWYAVRSRKFLEVCCFLLSFVSLENEKGGERFIFHHYLLKIPLRNKEQSPVLTEQVTKKKKKPGLSRAKTFHEERFFVCLPGLSMVEWSPTASLASLFKLFIDTTYKQSNPKHIQYNPKHIITYYITETDSDNFDFITIRYPILNYMFQKEDFPSCV